MKTVSKSAIAGLVLGSAALFGLSAPASAATYNYFGTVTLCTATCDSFDSLAVGTEISGSVSIDTLPGGAWTFADVSSSFAYNVFNPALPVVPFDGTNPTAANPLPLNELIAPIVAGPAGPLALTTGGTTDANNELNGGYILHQFIVAPFNSNDAWVLFDLATGDAQVCVLYALLGCVPGATQVAVIDGGFTLEAAVVPVPAAVWLFGSALLGLAGLRRRS